MPIEEQPLLADPGIALLHEIAACCTRLLLAGSQRAARLPEGIGVDTHVGSDGEKILEAKLGRTLALRLLIDCLGEHIADLARRETLRFGRALRQQAMGLSG